MLKPAMLWISCFLFLSVTACAPKDQAAEMDYDETKKMVVDILKTDDGKKAIQEILNDDKMNETLVMDEKTVKETVEKTMTSKKGAEFWKKVFEDPKFAEGFAKTLQTEHEKVLKKAIHQLMITAAIHQETRMTQISKRIIKRTTSKKIQRTLIKTAMIKNKTKKEKNQR
ncbi:spore germination lipoprotein GerD, partial [Bacillus sonorensis]|uniref:spore germination lipoprotein GerD n=1 Tax=Bacillus sonorensis TaxID=119858 RepID=UPI0022825FDA